MRTLPLMLRMLARDVRAGELTVLALAIVIAVASLTSVSFLTDRLAKAFAQQSHQLLGGDLRASADHPWDPAMRAEAQRRGLRVAESITFPSMVASGETGHLAEIKAVGEGYPLRGSLRLAPALNSADRETGGIPPPGQAWLDERLSAALKTQPGEKIHVGQAELAMAAVLTMEPDRGVNLFSLAPRLMLNIADLAATELIQPGSRVRYRLHFAGEAETVAAFADWLRPRLGRGERLQDLSNARPEIRSIVDRAQRFLGLAALLAVVLAAVAVGFAADRYMRHHLDACAVMRCLGARQNQILQIHGGEFLLLGLLTTLAGCVAGYVFQWALEGLLAGVLEFALPQPSLLPVAHGLLVGAALVTGFTLPPLLRLRQVSTLRVLRREWAGDEALSWLAYACGALALGLLMLWIAGEAKLFFIVLAGFAAALLLYAGIARALLVVAGRVGAGAGAGWRLGLANLRRHSRASVLQATALALGITALLLLTVAQSDFVDSWRRQVPLDAPNRFLINIQPEQRAPLQAFFAARGLAAPHLEPMVRGRLVAINGEPVAAKNYEDERAQRLVEREFNLSWSGVLPGGNTVAAGRWHGSQGAAADGQKEFSVEAGLAETLGLKLGDLLTYEIAGVRLAGRITSLRRLDWDSMRVNFFVIAAPGMLEEHPASYITSFYLPPGRPDFVHQLVRDFPNLTLIDVAALLRQLQTTVDQLTRALQAVFAFALVAGFIVLYAALQASFDERRAELALLRALGARSRQLAGALLAEFSVLGATAGLLAGIGAIGIAAALAKFVFRLQLTPDPLVLLLGVAAGAIGVALAGWLGTVRVLREPALAALRAE